MHERFIANGRWYYTLTIGTVGLFAWVPFLHAGSRLLDGRQRQRAAAYGALAVVIAVLASLVPTDSQGNTEGTFGNLLSAVVAIGAVGVIATACVQLRPLRMAVYGIVDPHRKNLTASEIAVNQALAARQRRDEARALAARDPNLARDLGIGRPDRTRDYDDGGVVDLNSQSADVLVSMCGLDRASADRVVDRRQQGGGFSSVQEVLAYVELSERESDALRDRGIVLPL